MTSELFSTQTRAGGGKGFPVVSVVSAASVVADQTGSRSNRRVLDARRPYFISKVSRRKMSSKAIDLTNVIEKETRLNSGL